MAEEKGPRLQSEQQSDIKSEVLGRRRFIKRTAIVAASLTVSGAVLAACGDPTATTVPATTVTTTLAATTTIAGGTPANPTSGPTIATTKYKDIVLRQVGTGVSAINEIRDQAQKDLGFKIEMKAVDTDTNNQIAVTQPKQYDIFDGEFFSLPLVLPSGNLQPIDTKRITEFSKIAPLFINGKLTPDSKIAQGTAPHKVMFVSAKDGTDATKFATEPTQWATLIPHQYNADTLGIRRDLIKRPIESWAELFNPEFKGKASILNIPSIGIMDAAMVTEAAGLMKFADKGNMTKAEIDKVTGILIEQKKAGQFRAFWKTFDESVNLMVSGEVLIQSMWSPAITAARAKGIDAYYVPLKEGYRAWGGGLGLSKNLSGLALDAAYEYLNWWISGWPGGFIGRQGYYSSIPENARKFMTPEEWDYWYEGKPAATDIIDPFKTKIDSKGNTRDGGSFLNRMGKVECWNSVMTEQDYLVKKWNEFIAA